MIHKISMGYSSRGRAGGASGAHKMFNFFSVNFILMVWVMRRGRNFIFHRFSRRKKSHGRKFIEGKRTREREGLERGRRKGWGGIFPKKLSGPGGNAGLNWDGWARTDVGLVLTGTGTLVLVWDSSELV